MKLSIKSIIGSFLALAVSSCGGGGGGGDSASPGHSGQQWSVKAFVTSDNCGERISDVQQPFFISGSGNSVVIDTSIVKIPGVSSGSGFSGAFQESNGDCQRTYTVNFSDVGSTANVELVSQTQCPSVSCESRWNGEGVKVN